MRRLLAASVVILALSLPVAAVAQSREGTLADIRQELSVMLFQIESLRRELSTTQGAPGGFEGGSVLDRVDAVENQLQRLVARTEEMENRINQIVADGTNRIGDLEFRLVELEGGDLGAIQPTPPLGGEAPGPAAGPAQPDFALPALPGADDGGAQLAVSERDDFDRAREAFEAGDYQQAADGFARFSETYGGGPLSIEAFIMRGRAHSALGQETQAARAYLDAFNADPDGAQGAQALLGLGNALAALGQHEEGCLMLGEVGNRFPGASEAAQAASARSELGCP